MKKISVIIPVYNSENYLGQCVRSLTSQTYKDWEALLIDDGSTDRSLEVCRGLSGTDSRIKVYHQENKGVSAARNYGLEIAGGEYIYFLDSDDAVHPLLFEEMIRQIEDNHVEMAFCGYAHVDDRQLEAALTRASLQDKRPRWKVGDGEEAERWFHIDHAMVLCAVSGMVARDLIGPLRFDEALSHGEDTVFKHALFRKQVRTAYSPQRWYYYRNNPQGLNSREEFLVGDAYTAQTILIRDIEYREGNIMYALVRETELSCQLRQRYERSRKIGSEYWCRRIRASAFRERWHPLFRSVDMLHKGLFYLCFRCYLLYVPVSCMARAVWRLIRLLRNFKTWMQT